ncbi:MAG TPA: winged helix-turn-helix transcriptional regulator [Thermoplasmata archaeon]|nr:winged helix-turn-helix transcriptional regulator [Thermoplasmata archaeon]
MDLDATDVAILRTLLEDARASLRTITKRVGVSVPTVSAHVRNLEQLGIIRGYRVVLDSERLSESGATLIVETKPRSEASVARTIASRSWARRVLTGPQGSILVDVSAPSREAVATVRKEVSAMPRVTRVREYAGLTTVKDEPTVLPREGLVANIPCFECRGPIHGEPVRARLGGRYHYFCCHSCERLYLERYRRIQAAARERP